MKMILKLFTCLFFLLACTQTENNHSSDETKSVSLHSDFNAYWYGGEAEITSYNLTQARYGELREGSAVLVFVTEPFSKSKLVKPNTGTENDASVLKLNFTKKFTTGIYPYSMMTSTFLPVTDGDHSMKISSSSQEWCGHTYMELENREKFEVDIRSYFENESEEIQLNKEFLEDDIWSKIRLNPSELPTGDMRMIPSFFYLRLKHKACKSYQCNATRTELENGMNTYSVNYPDLKRSITILYTSDFPHEIVSWEETYPDGYSSNSPLLTTKAERIKTLKSAYWNQNSNADSGLRVELGLD